MRIRFYCLAPEVRKRRRTPRSQPRNVSPLMSGTGHQQPACKNDIRAPARRLIGVDAHRFLGCECELRVRS